MIPLAFLGHPELHSTPDRIPFFPHQSRRLPGSNTTRLKYSRYTTVVRSTNLCILWSLYCSRKRGELEAGIPCRICSCHFRAGAGINTGTMEFYYRTRARGCWTDGDFFFSAQRTRRAATCIHFSTCATQNIPRNGTGPTDGIGLSGTQLDRSRTGGHARLLFRQRTGDIGRSSQDMHKNDRTSRKRPAGRDAVRASNRPTAAIVIV